MASRGLPRHAVDTVTQWQVVGCVETICENHLVPVLENMLHQFRSGDLGLPLRQRIGVHQSESRPDAEQALLVEFTRSRAYPDHRQRAGRGQEWRGGAQACRLRSDRLRARRSLAEVLHRLLQPLPEPSSAVRFSAVVTDRRGKHERRYRANDYRTPYEKLISLKKWQQYLKPGIPADLLARQSRRRSATPKRPCACRRPNCELLAKCRACRDDPHQGRLPLVGPAAPQRSGAKTKTFSERKNQIRPVPRRSPASR